MVTVMGLRGFKGSDWDCTGFGHSYLCHYHIINLLHYYPTTLLQRSLLQQNHASMSGWKERLHYLV